MLILKLKVRIRGGSCRRLWRWAVIGLLALRAMRYIFDSGIPIQMC